MANQSPEAKTPPPSRRQDDLQDSRRSGEIEVVCIGGGG